MVCQPKRDRSRAAVTPIGLGEETLIQFGCDPRHPTLMSERKGLSCNSEGVRTTDVVRSGRWYLCHPHANRSP